MKRKLLFNILKSYIMKLDLCFVDFVKIVSEKLPFWYSEIVSKEFTSSTGVFRCSVYFDKTRIIPGIFVSSCSDLLLLNCMYYGKFSFYVDFDKDCLCLNVVYRYE